jgi:hypothetical protein
MSADKRREHEMKLRNDRREIRRSEGVERRAERAARTPQEQIEILDRRLGAGQGASRERAKLAALISK